MMKEYLIFPEEVRREFSQAALIGKTIKDLYFYGDDRWQFSLLFLAHR